jgi:alpha-tubulin suppressor-like RCC1 family protein
MNTEILCINSNYSKEHLEFFNKHNVVFPQEGKIYNLRYKKQHSHGEWGLTVMEIVNPKVPIGFYNDLSQEQTFNLKRFTDLSGNPLLAEKDEILEPELEEVKINKFYN